VAAPVSGTWRRSSGALFDVPAALHLADRRHKLPGHDTDPGAHSYHAPAQIAEGPAGEEYFATQDVLDSGGLVLDTTPSTHDDGLGVGVEPTSVTDMDTPGGADWDLLAKTHPRHARNQGAPARSTYQPRQFQFHDERYEAPRVEGFGPEATDGLPALAGGGGRGLNGLSVNNPPLESYGGRGFRYGTTEQSWVRRKFPVRIIQRHDALPWTPNLAVVDTDAPPPARGTPYTSPFSALQRMLGDVAKQPHLRRTPPGLEVAALVSEGEPDTTSDVIGADASWAVA